MAIFRWRTSQNPLDTVGELLSEFNLLLMLACLEVYLERSGRAICNSPTVSNVSI